MLYDPETQTLYRNQSEAKKLGLPKVSTAPRPDVDAGQVAVRDDMPTEQGDGSWRFEWTVERMSDTEIKRAVNVERDRRVAAGTTVAVTGYGDVPVQGGVSDQINMIALDATAKSLKASGETGAIIPFRDAVDIMHDLTPDQMIELVAKSKQVATAIYAVSWDMKDGTGDFTGGIPTDFTDDSYWP
ncbi:hypothetical protein [Roseovarius sp.]|uniref:DUF4376 domain-containing protein n=1 Tax=Roseovarius sp. TaxID=1486281 RepID=UPI003BA8BDB6